MKVRRTWLVVPALSTDRVSRARTCRADVVVVDLAYFCRGQGASKEAAAAKAAIAALSDGPAELFLQVRASSMAAQLVDSVRPGLAGVILAGVESAERVIEADELLTRLELSNGLAPGSLEIVTALESAAGNQNAQSIVAATPRTTSASLGRADLVMDLRPEPSGAIHLLDYLAQRLILLAGALGKQALGARWTSGDRGLSTTPGRALQAARMGRTLGFRGSLCVRENMIAPLRVGFTPSAAEVAAASRFLQDMRDRGTDECWAAAEDSRSAGAATRLLAFADACAEQDRKLGIARSR